MKAIAKRAKGFFVVTLLAALVFSSCGGFFDDVSAADSSPTYAPSAAGNSAPISYAINIDQSIEHGSVASSTASANPASKAVEGETVTLAASPDDGYALASLTYTPKGGSPINVGGNGNSRTFTMPKSDVSVSAEFTAIAYSVNVADSITGGRISATPTNANAGQTISLTAAAGAGWKLKAWDVKDEAGNSIPVANNAFDMPSGNVSVSAVFVKIDYSITISDTTNGRVTADKTAANYGDTVTLTARPSDGYALAALTYALRGEEPVNITGSGGRRSFEMPAGDVTVAATFTPVAFSVNVADSITGGRISATPTNANVGQTISLTASADTGWKLKSWNVVAQGGAPVTVTNNKFTMPAKNVSVSATFEKINYSITVLPSDNGSVTGLPATATVGTEIALSNTPNAGYKFVSYTVRGADGTAVTVADGKFTMPAKDVTVSATFSAINYSVNVGTIANGSVTATPTTATAGTEITLSNKPNAGYQFASYTVTAADGTSVAVTNGTFTMPASGVTVTAAFAALPPAAYTKAGTQTINGVEYDIVTFGSWPQTIKAANVEVDERCESKTVGDFTYYKGSDGQWYVHILENGLKSQWNLEYDPKYSDGSDVKDSSYNSYRWFKVEPIKWRVLTTDYNGTGKKLLLAENVLATCAFSACDIDAALMIDRKLFDPNVWEYSKVRAFLNGRSYLKKESVDAEQITCDEFLNKGFLKTAFNDSEIATIVDTSVDVSARSTNPDANAKQWNNGKNLYASDTPTTDKVFLLSTQEATKSAYGFDDCYVSDSKRIRFPTDYAAASGASLGFSNCCWLLRSPEAECYYYAQVIRTGGVLYSFYTNVDSAGVVPALCVEN